MGISIAQANTSNSDSNFSKRRISLFKRIFALLVSAVILTTSVAFQSVQAQGPNSNAAAKARLKVDSLSANARVEVKLLDGTKLKGYLNSKDQDGFTIADSKTGATSVVRYSEVSEVKKAGGGVSTKALVIIGSAIAAGVVTWIIIKPVLCDGGAQTRGPC